MRKSRIGIILAVLGPGIITASVDNDAGGIAIYSIAGAHFGYHFLWTLLPIGLFLIVIQEMSARMGVVTGKGFADLIRENYGVKITFWLMVILFFTNYANAISEFAGVAAGFEIFGVSKYISVPIAALFVWLLIVKGTYSIVEKIFLFASLFYVTYAISAFMTGPDWGEVLTRTVVPSFEMKPGFIIMLVALVGTTIAPWMQFYLQSSVVEKGLHIEDYRVTKYDVIIGSFITVLVALFIMVACSMTLFPKGIKINDAQDAAMALMPLAGKYAGLIFAFGLINASLFAASILPLSTAYCICEGMGWEAGVNKTFKEAPQFMWLYTIIVIGGALIILIPKIPLIPIMVFSQVANGILLPFILIFILRLVNKRELMGDYVNSKGFNIIAWTCTVIMIILSAVMTIDLIVPGAIL